MLRFSTQTKYLLSPSKRGVFRTLNIYSRYIESKIQYFCFVLSNFVLDSCMEVFNKAEEDDTGVVVQVSINYI